MTPFPRTPRNKALAPLSSLIRDPRVRAAFESAERDMGGALPVPAVQPGPRTLPNGATMILEAADAE